MKTWTSILTAGAVLAIAASAANATVPTDAAERGSGHVTRTALHRVSHNLKQTTMHDARIQIMRGSYYRYAYVPGGSSTKVAQAISDAAERTQG